ncbi:MAG: hypothetical protein ACOY8P_07870 [Thermodesulfobacteriota bacterium]
MRITIIHDDGVVGVDGVFRPVDLGVLPDNIHAVQFDTDAGSGHVEHRNPQRNRAIDQAAWDVEFGWFVELWEQAA